MLRCDQCDYAQALAISPDGDSLAAASSHPGPNGMWQVVWSLSRQRGMQHLRGLTGEIVKVRFSRDGKRVAALAHTWDVGVWDLDTGRLLHVLAAPLGPFADNADLQFSPDGEELAFCGGQEARRWALKSGRETGRWAMPPGLADSLLFHAKTGVLIVCRAETRDGKLFPFANAHPAKHPRVVRLHELKAKGERKLIAEKNDFATHVYDCVASPDGSCFVVEGIPGRKDEKVTIKTFSPTGDELWGTTLDTRYVGPKIDAAGKKVCFGSTDRSMSVVEATTGRVVGSISAHVSALGADGERWVRFNVGKRGEWAGFEYFLHGAHGPIVNLGIDHRGSDLSSQFNRAGTHFAWGNEDGTVVVCDLPDVQRRLAAIELGW